jgi:hypothetical protein
MTDIRLLFNKSCAKSPKRRKMNNDEEASKVPSKTDTDEQHEAPGLIERESGETLQSETAETVSVRLDVAAQVDLPPTREAESESECQSQLQQ